MSDRPNPKDVEPLRAELFVSPPHLKPSWTLIENGYYPARELETEALMTVSNGYTGTRGTLFERGSPLGPGTLVAGIFDRIPGDTPVPGLVAAPDWIRLRIELLPTEETLQQEGGLTSGRQADNRRILDMRQGIMWRELKHHDLEDRTTSIQGFRLASQGDRHLLIQSFNITPENYSGQIRIETESELYQTGHKSYMNPYPFKATVVHDPKRSLGSPAVVSYTYPAGAEIAFASASRLILDNGQILYPQISRIECRVAEHWEIDAEIGKTYRIERLVSIFTSRDGSRPALKAREHLKEAWKTNIQQHVETHIEEWTRRWSLSNIQIDGDTESDRALRFACYGLISAANPEDERVSIGARALTGNSYLGHVFWDTEIFMVPFFIYTAPDLARSLLMYRYHTLDGARKNAEKNGYRGAMYPWESADTGEETTPPSMPSPKGDRIRILTGEQEHHITADVAYSVWRYCETTGDEVFQVGPGAEILIETARFWASRAELGEDEQYHIHRIIGPDEYHEDISDSVFTNEMARWNLDRAAQLVEKLSTHYKKEWDVLSKNLSFDLSELKQWRDTAERLYRPRIRDDVIEQFRGYFDLEDITTTKENQPGGMDFRIFLDLERLKKTQLIKQADVLMLLHLFPDRYTDEVLQKNFDYYENRTLHGSSLSPAIYGSIAARIGKSDKAMHYYKMAAEVDLRNNMSNASGGVHSAAQGGLWQATVFGFAGLTTTDQGISFDPKLPSHWQRLRFSVLWRGQHLSVSLTAKNLEVIHNTSEEGQPIPIRFKKTSPVLLEPTQTRKWSLL